MGLFESLTHCPCRLGSEEGQGFVCVLIFFLIGKFLKAEHIHCRTFGNDWKGNNAVIPGSEAVPVAETIFTIFFFSFLHGKVLDSRAKTLLPRRHPGCWGLCGRDQEVFPSASGVWGGPDKESATGLLSVCTCVSKTFCYKKKVMGSFVFRIYSNVISKCLQYCFLHFQSPFMGWGGTRNCALDI